MKTRVRYAPSPTGHLHIGNARTALFNYLFAKKHQGTFIVRIEDTDLERNVEMGIESQMKDLAWLGIIPDESIELDGGYGPYRQLERLDIYQHYADVLLKAGLAYKCYCTPEELKAEREAQIQAGQDQLHYSRKCLHSPEQAKPYTLRFKVPENETYTFNDLVKKEVTFKSSDIGDWVILKQNNIPTYNFACAIDDHLMRITHVLRGEDHITNTPKQMMIYRAFNWDIPVFGHMTLIVNESQKKLSKRDESIIQFIDQYKSLGYLPEALFNFISLLGYSPKEEGDIFSKETLIKDFDEDRLSTSPATFDQAKLAYINNRYIKALSLEETVALCKPFLDQEKITINKTPEWIESLVEVFKDRLVYGKQITELYYSFIERELKIDEEALEFLNQEGIKTLLEIFKTKLLESDELSKNDYKSLIKESGKASNMKGKMLFMPIRIAISGSMHGPDLPALMHLLGKNTLVNHLNFVLNHLK